MPAPTDFLDALGAAFRGYGQDQSLRDASDDRDAQRTAVQAQKDAELKRQMAKDAMEQDNRVRDDAVKGIMPGTAPSNLSMGDQYGGFSGMGMQNIGTAAMMASADQAQPGIANPSRFQQVTSSSYLDRFNMPEAIASRRSELSARLADERMQSHETFLQGQQNRAIAAQDARSAATRDAQDRRAIVPIDTTYPDGTKTQRYVTKSQAVAEGSSPVAKGSASGPAGQLQQARMLAAISEARLADERMRAFEDKMIGGTEKISPLSQMGGNLAANLAGSHTVMGAGTQALAEGGLNMTQPTYAQYLRDAATIGRAEQMIMPRGGTETMVRANALLARAGTGANKATIDAARMARQALFGKAGGIAQTMSPSQTSGLESGLEKIKSGNVSGGHVPTYEEWKAAHP